LLYSDENVSIGTTFCSLIQVLSEDPGSMLGRDLEALIQRARNFKKEYGDSFVSVEHLVLGFADDKRFGRQLFKDFQINVKTLKAAIESIRGKQNVVDQGMISLIFP
jgi:ATP-dependent Clp protease ATP-binding subunit ClpB